MLVSINGGEDSLDLHPSLPLGCKDFTTPYAKEKGIMGGYTIRVLKFVLVCCLISIFLKLTSNIFFEPIVQHHSFATTTTLFTETDKVESIPQCMERSTTKMDHVVIKELNSYVLFLIEFGHRLYTGQADTYLHEIANSSYTSNVTHVLVGLYWHIGLAPGCIYYTTLYDRSKGIVCCFKLNFIVPVHCLISIGLLAQLKVGGVAQNGMVGFVQQGKKVFPNLEVVDRQEYVVAICLDDTQLLSTILYACVASQYVAVKIIERLNLLIQVHSRTYTFATFSSLSNSLWLLRSCFKSSCSPQHLMIQLDFNVWVEAIDPCAMCCYGFAVTFNVHNMISTSYISEYMQKTMKGKYSMIFDACDTSYFFPLKKTLQFTT
jgi:hypothetical protein